MSNLVEHARRELQLCGQWAEDPAYAATVVATVAAFVSYGHSGGSAMLAVQQLTRLLNYEHLTPLTDDPDEWEDRSQVSGSPMWQNTRNPAAISYDGGRTYYNVNEHSGVDDGPPVWHTSMPRAAPRSPSPADRGGFSVPAEIYAAGYRPDGWVEPVGTTATESEENSR